MVQDEYKWYRLDNAAKIYPAVSDIKRSGVFRVAAILRHTVQESILQQALDLTVGRFPTFRVRMCKGLFWYYFENNDRKPVALQEHGFPCQSMEPYRHNGYLFEVSFNGSRINLEVFHAITDATGAMMFLKTLVYHYLVLAGFQVLPGDGMLTAQIPFSKREIEDGFKKYYDPNVKGSLWEKKAAHLSGTEKPQGVVSVLCGIISVSDMKRLARENGATITEYLAALYIYAIVQAQLLEHKERLPVKVSIPVNLRRFFPSYTLRNFASYVNVEVAQEAGSDFKRTLESVTRQMRKEINPECLACKINANVGAERNLLLRAVPLFIKNLVLKQAYNFVGETLFTTSMSNLGAVTTSETMGQHIERFEFVLGVSGINPVNCGICSYGDSLVVAFTRAIEETDIEKHFFRFLAQQGLHVVIETLK